ncbi:MAG: methyltransferase domain-containing protein [Gammaproteobacteria bacterium]|nr:methyltransferase domain-containing protein [Gammaproteobacteria bacterium]
MIANDARVLLHLLRGQPRRGSQAERLQAFYAPQASRYDAFRERLLHGRRELIGRLDALPGAAVVELGAGTGRNLLFFGNRLADLDVQLVDLCPALLEQARRRTADMDNVRVVDADVVSWRPERPVDVVYLSYSLTMIPDWQGAIDNAIGMLKPGGSLGVVDFYVSAAQPAAGLERHGPLARAFWPRWFAHDGVHLDPAHLDCLRARLPDHELLERRAKVPYLAGLSVPYYVFIGRRPAPLSGG